MRKTHRTRPWSTAALALIAILPHGSAQAGTSRKLGYLSPRIPDGT
jgi:hypothetical protein